MSQIFLFNASFHLLLNQIDQAMADNILQQRCPYCKGNLHKADYPRSPLGVLAEFRHHYETRLSFCCADCRKRTTSASVRFFGRRWYPAPFVMLISILSLGISKRRLAQFKRHFGFTVSESTWRRWRRWWRDMFDKTRFWMQEKGRLPSTPAIMHGPYPRVLFDIFQGEFEKRICLLLRFLAPLTAGSLRAV